ncbi:MAG: DUF6478 family protein [Albidovulum sp.]
MIGKRKHVLGRLLQRLRLVHWQRSALRAKGMTLAAVRRLRGDALQLRKAIDQVLVATDERVQLPVIGSDVMRKPINTDWAWRPHLWSRRIMPFGAAGVASPYLIDDEVELHHDCPKGEISLRQMRNARPAELAAFGLRMDVFGFAGSYLSVTANLPQAAIKGLTLRHLICVNLNVETERPLQILVRLNIKHGPNTERLVSRLNGDGADKMVEFDLAYAKIVEKRIEHIWVDVICDAPGLNEISLRDLTISRRPRAEL